jgi:uncharacterized coiled-coil protein SlyX
MNDETVERLELKISYLERANQELSDAVFRQQQQLEELQARVAMLAGRLEAARADEQPYTQEEERPPHY